MPYDQPNNIPNSQIYHDVCCNGVIYTILHTDVIQMSQTLEGQSEDKALKRDLSLSFFMRLCNPWFNQKV